LIIVVFSVFITVNVVKGETKGSYFKPEQFEEDGKAIVPKQIKTTSRDNERCQQKTSIECPHKSYGSNNSHK
jgi:hypothetical protein